MLFQNLRTPRVVRSCLLGGSLAYARPIWQQISTLPEETEVCVHEIGILTLTGLLKR